MKLLTALLLSLGLAGSVFAKSSKVPDISHADLEKAVAAKSVVLLDANGTDSFAEGRIAGKAAVKYVMEKGRDQPQVSEQEYRDLERTIFQPMENFRVGRNEIVAGTVSPSYLLPIHGLQRLEKIMDEDVGGVSTNYMTNDKLLARGLELLQMLKEDMEVLGAVRLRDVEAKETVEYHIVGSAEADPAEHRLSNESPVGRAIEGHHPGEIVEVRAPHGIRHLRIARIARARIAA